jgi:integrase
LKVPLSDDRSLKAWTKAGYGKAQDYLNQCAKAPAQAGRSAAIDDKVSIATVKHRAVVLKSCYDELIARGLLEINPFVRIVRELRKHRPGERRPHEAIPLVAVKKLLGWEPRTVEERRDLAALHLLFGAALRRGELAGLRCGDILQTEQGTTYLRLTHTKSQHVQKVALADWCAEVVKVYFEQRREEGARELDPFIVRYREHKSPRAVSGDWIYDMFRSYCRLFRLPDNYTPHCARVTAITQMLEQQIPHREVQELSRHSSVQMVEKYDRKRVEIDESAPTKLRYK